LGRLLTQVADSHSESTSGKHLLPNYDVRMEEYLMRTSEEETLHRVVPDITISTPNWWSDGSGRGGTAVLEPATSEMEYPEVERHTERHLQIIHRATERVVRVYLCSAAVTGAR
jgi:hypothetical protein